MSEEASLDDFNVETNQSSNLELGPIEIDVPEAWDSDDFSNLLEITTGNNYTGDYLSDEDNGGRIFLTLKSVSKEGGFNWDSIKYYSGDVNGHEIVEPGELLIANTDLTQDGAVVGYSARVPDFDSKKEIAASMDLSILRPKIDGVNLPYVEYLLQTDYIHSRMRAFSAGSTVLHLNTDLVETLSLPLPPLEEQRKIATVLYTVDQAIQKTESVSQQLSTIRRGLRQDIFSSQFGDETTKEVRTGPIGIEIPQNWEIRALGEFVDEFVGGATLSKDDFSESGISVIPKKAVGENGIATVDKEEQQFTTEEIADGNHTNMVGSGYLITALRDLNADAPSIGRIVKIDRTSGYPSGKRFLLAQGVHGMNTSPEICDDYLIEISNSDWYRRYMKSISVGSTQIHIRNDEFLGIEIPVPPLGEQEEIATRLRDIVRHQSKEENYRNQLQRLKQGLMQDLLSGTVRTYEADIDIPEAVLTHG